MKEERKKRFWTFVLYPESAPADWREQIQLSGVLSAVSPLHDKDQNADFTPKKPHWHVILVWPGPTTYNNVAQFTASLNGTIPQGLESVRGMYNYFTHKDNPEKAQYCAEDIYHINGFNLGSLVELSRSEVNELKRKVLQRVREWDILEYADLVDMLLDNELGDEYDIVVNNTFFFNSYIASRRFGFSRCKLREASEGNICNAETVTQ